jgi:hypothetical protein
VQIGRAARLGRGHARREGVPADGGVRRARRTVRLLRDDRRAAGDGTGRDEAERLIRPAIWDVTTGALGDGDWNPTLNWLDVIELLDD